MAKLFKPEIHYDNVRKQYPTYAELKKNLKEHIENSSNKKVSVFRSRRGEWGEWFEHWSFNYKRNPIIIKHGWM